MATISKSQVHSFIRTSLVSELRKDLQSFKLVREADVECAAYMHLRHFLDSDPKWTVLARRHVPQTGYYVDLVIFQGKSPRMAIEIKWGRTAITSKDRASLRAAITELGVNKAYWLSAAVLGNNATPLNKEDDEKKSLFQLSIRADLSLEERARWVEVRDSFRSKMKTGSGRKLNGAK